MPEYNNVKQDKPKITATFKFRNMMIMKFLKTKLKNIYTMMKKYLMENKKKIKNKLGVL